MNANRYNLEGLGVLISSSGYFYIGSAQKPSVIQGTTVWVGNGSNTTNVRGDTISVGDGQGAVNLSGSEIRLGYLSSNPIRLGRYGSDFADCYWRDLNINGTTYSVLTKA